MHFRLLKLIRDSRINLAITILSGFMAGLLTIWQAWLLSNTINNVFLENQSLSQVWDLLRIILYIIAGRAFLMWLNETSAKSIAVKIKTDLRNRLLAHIQNIGPTFARSKRTGELTSTTIDNIEALDAYFSQYLPQLLISTLVPVSILFFVFPLDLLSTIILLVTAPLIPLFMYLIGKGSEIITQQQYETLSRLSAHFLDSLQGLSTLKLFDQSKHHVDSIAMVSKQFRDITMSVLRITFLSALALELLSTLSTAIIAVEIGLRLLYARMDFLHALFILILAPEFYLPLRMLGLRFHAGMDGTSAARRIFEILDTEIDERNLWEREKDSSEQPDPVSLIKFTNLSFTYPNESFPALHKINLEISAGEHIALVGPNGAGKSTLIYLLLGFIKQSSGQLITYHKAGSKYYGPPFNNNIAWVPQHPYLFHETIAFNIKFGRPDAKRDEVIIAAERAYLNEFVESLPEGYNTVIGEGGARLSSGQVQRLALARAFLMDAPILILDESTSNLDPETETLLQRSTHQLMKTKSVITIAHRLNTVFQADQILVLNKGQIVEQGRHKELMAKKGLYSEMVNSLKAKYSSRKVESEQFQRIANQYINNGPGLRNEHQDLPENLPKTSYLFRLLLFLSGSWKWIALSIILGSLTIGANVLLLGTSAWLISSAALHPSIAELSVAVVSVRFFGICRAVSRYFERLVSHNVTFRLLARMRVWFYQKLEPLAPSRLIDFRSGDLLSRIMGDIEILENFYVRVVSPPLVALVIGSTVSIFLGYLYLPLAIVYLSIYLILGILLPFFSQILSRNPGRDLITLRAELSILLVDGIQGLADILAFSQADEYLVRVVDIDQQYGKAQKSLAQVSGFISGLNSLFTNLCLWLVVYISIPQLTEGNLSGLMLAPLALLTLASFEAVIPLPLTAQMWESIRRASQRLFEVVDMKPEVYDRISYESETSPKELLPTLEFSNLTFSYPNQALPVLRNVSFRLEPGMSIAIIGASGAGKTTLLNLLLRFWEYDSGEIRLGNTSLKSLSQDKIRSCYSVVSQNPYLFNSSIYENIHLGRESATKEDVEHVMRLVNLHDFTMSLPNGYQTNIGEKGQRLSGGERQRLVIARAFLKDAPILILDEPTANLDPSTEKQILSVLFDMMKTRSSLLITHRLVGLENIGELLVMENGQIVERGNHKNLLASGCTYRRMWETQNRILDL